MKDIREVVTIELPNKVVQLKLTSFDTDIDTDSLTQIQYHNIMGEILTSSVILNRIGNLKAEVENLLNETKLDFDIFYAHQEEKCRKEMTFTKTDPKGVTKVEKPSISEIEQAIVRSPEYKVKKKHLFQIQKSVAYIDSLYWSCQSKDSKLNKLSEKLRPEEFEKDLLEESINGVMISIKNKAIK